MKKLTIVILILTTAAVMLSGCGQDLPAATQLQETATPLPTATPAPDFSGTDFTGSWYVSQVLDSNGSPVSDERMQEMGADFTLELLGNGMYFVYDAEGATLGQGAYSVTQNMMTCTVGEQQTVYQIQDADTLRCTADDRSVTVMSRIIEEADDTAVDEDNTDGETDVTGNDDAAEQTDSTGDTADDAGEIVPQD